jgi:hypothetical protein
VTAHRRRVCHFVIDCDDFDRSVSFWSAALDAAAKNPTPRRATSTGDSDCPDTEIRVLLQRTDEALHPQYIYRLWNWFSGLNGRILYDISIYAERCLMSLFHCPLTLQVSVGEASDALQKRIAQLV